MSGWVITVRRDGIAECTNAERAWELSVIWGVVQGRPEPSQLTIAVAENTERGTSYLNAETIRSLPLGRVVDELRSAGDPVRFAKSRLATIQEQLAELDGHQRDSVFFGGGFKSLHDEMMELDALATATETLLEAAAQGPQRGRTRTLADHEGVATVYRSAYERGDPVTEAVARAFHVSRSTAGKRIMAARRAGLLEGIGRTR